MGLRPAVVVGITGLVLVILGTFIFMAVLKIDLQRMSLGTLIIDVGRDHVWTHAGNGHYDGASADGVLIVFWNQKSRRQRGKQWWDFNSASRLTNSFEG
jgi:hypothetical protein